jgi:hypothetical protein
MPSSIPEYVPGLVDLPPSVTRIEVQPCFAVGSCFKSIVAVGFVVPKYDAVFSSRIDHDGVAGVEPDIMLQGFGFSTSRKIVEDHIALFVEIESASVTVVLDDIPTVLERGTGIFAFFEVQLDVDPRHIQRIALTIVNGSSYVRDGLSVTVVSRNKIVFDGSVSHIDDIDLGFNGSVLHVVGISGEKRVGSPQGAVVTADSPMYTLAEKHAGKGCVVLVFLWIVGYPPNIFVVDLDFAMGSGIPGRVLEGLNDNMTGRYAFGSEKRNAQAGKSGARTGSPSQYSLCTVV